MSKRRPEDPGLLLAHLAMGLRSRRRSRPQGDPVVIGGTGRRMDVTRLRASSPCLLGVVRHQGRTLLVCRAADGTWHANGDVEALIAELQQLTQPQQEGRS